MKKILSIILAAMLVIGMLPTAFAAVDGATGAITYKFAFDTRREKNTYLETLTGGWSSYYKEYPSSPADAGANWAYHGTTISTPYSASKGVLVAMTDYTATGNAAAGEWLAFRINVPESGTYTVSAKGARKNTFSSGADLYIAPLTGELATQLAEGNTTIYGTVSAGARTGHKPFSSLSMPETAKVGSLSFKKSSSTTSVDELLVKEEMELTAGDNVVLYHVTADTAAPIYPASITITPVKVTKEPTITVSSDKAEILIDETATLTSTVTDSNGDTVTNPSVTYSTADTSIVSVNAETGVVTGLAEGTATITATYTEDGTAYPADVTVTVLSATMTYKFYSAYTDEDAPSDIEDKNIVTIESADGATKNYTTYGGADRPWAYLGASGTDSISDNDYVRIFNGYLSTGDLTQNQWLAFKIKVRKTASYSISGKAYLYKGSSGAVDMYIAPYADSAFESASTYSTVTDGTRTAGKALDELDISDYHVGTTSMNSSTAGDADMVITDAKEVILREGKDYVLLFNQSADVTRTLTPVSVTLTPHDIVPTVTVTASPSSILTDETATLTSTVTDSNGDTVANPSVTYTSNSDCVEVNGSTVTGKKPGKATITATYTEDGTPYTDDVEITVTGKTVTYLFNNSVINTAITSDAEYASMPYNLFRYREGGAEDGTVMYDGNFLGDINSVVVEGKGSEKWAVSRLGGEISEASGAKYNSAISTKGFLNMVYQKVRTHTTSGDARFVLELNVPNAGSYNITAGLTEDTYGADADIYIIKKSDVTDDITHDFLKDYPIVGRIGNATGKLDGDVGNYTFDEAGSYYFVFSFNSENVVVANRNQRLFLNSITLEEGTASVETPASETAKDPNFMAAANISGVKLTVDGTEEATSLVHSVTRGDPVTLSAPEVEGYNFVGWMRGTYNAGEAYNSKFVDLEENEDGTYTYNVWTNTYLTAVYEPAGDSEAPKVRFWNYDGSFLGEKLVSELDPENLPTASLIGYAFREWWVDENTQLDIENLTAAVTNAVAQYDKKSYLTENDGDEVTTNGSTSNTTEELFGERVYCEEEGATHWLRDGKIVAYGDTYSHYTWDGTHIHSSRAAVTPKPLVVLESTTVDGAYMIEYEAPEGYTIAEVGILFAASGTPDVNSASERFSSQRGTSRGQFAAAPSDESYTVARGYMIYTDNATGSAYVIYSK